MTIVIAMACSDGVLVASDSMGSSGRYATRVQKLQTRDDLDVVWANSGTEFLGQVLDNAVHAIDVDTTSTPMAIAKSVDPSLRTAVTMPLPHKEEGDQHQLESLIVGWVDGGATIVHIPADLATVECRHKEFVAIGSAHEYAHVVKATLDHYFAGPLTTQRASLLAFRIISVVCAASSWGSLRPSKSPSLTTRVRAFLAPATSMRSRWGSSAGLLSRGNNWPMVSSPQRVP